MRSFCAGALLTAVPVALNGCGGGGSTTPSPGPTTSTATTTTTTTTTLDTVCADNQGQCDHCLEGNCLSCKSGYVFLNGTVPGGTCVASCTNTTGPAKPSDPNGHSGIAWPQMCLSHKTSAHFYGIGDWGGDEPGHTWNNPGHAAYHGGPIPGPDDHGQYYVARQMKDLASQPGLAPDFVLNAGDNFYPGGYPDQCGTGQAGSDDPMGTFKSTFKEIYGGPGMDEKPWLGALGNHDYGGRSMEGAWDQAIFHTWNSDVWRTPATYWSQRVQYQDFAVQLIFLDSNYQDVHDTGLDPDHNICQGSYCWGIDGNKGCQQWFVEQWTEGIKMAERILSNSTAEWNIIVSHYPAIFVDVGIKRLHENYGLDVVFTGHNHIQSLTQSDDGFTTIVSGGGGGITSDAGVVDLKRGDDGALGFVDFEISRTEMKINMHTWGGCTSCDATEGPAEQTIHESLTITPHGSKPGPSPTPSPSPSPTPSPSPPAPTPSADAQCCWGVYTGGCEDYQGTGGLCNNDWTKTCSNNEDCGGTLLV